MHGMWEEPGMDPGDLLCQFLLVYERLRSMPADVVRRVLFFEPQDPFPCEATSDPRRRKHKWSVAPTADTGGLGQEAMSPQ
jgi:hypothetical protein